MNMEVTEIFGRNTITASIKAARLRYAGRVSRMDDDRTAKKSLDRKFDGTRSRGRPRKRWQDCVVEDTESLGVSDWRRLAENRNEWRSLVESAKTRLG